MLQQQFTSLRALSMRLVHDDRKLRSHVGGSVTIRKTDDGHILRNPEPAGLNGIKGSIGDDIVERQNSIWAVFAPDSAGEPAEVMVNWAPYA